MILSHGESSLERAFSMNEEILEDKLIKKTLVSEQLIYNNENLITRNKEHLS